MATVTVSQANPEVAQSSQGNMCVLESLSKKMRSDDVKPKASETCDDNVQCSTCDYSALPLQSLFAGCNMTNVTIVLNGNGQHVQGIQ